VFDGVGEAVGEKRVCFGLCHAQLRRPYELGDAIVELTNAFCVGMVAA